jgi:ERCC4-related helicase
MPDTARAFLHHIKNNVSEWTFRQGHNLFANGAVQLLSQAEHTFHWLVKDTFQDIEIKIIIYEDKVQKQADNQVKGWDAPAIAALMAAIDLMSRRQTVATPANKGIRYTFEGMTKRVLAERAEKAQQAQYHLELAANPFGEHLLRNEKNKTYRITFRDFDREIGYCSCPDYQVNKLGTCKHLMFAFGAAKKQGLHEAAKPELFPFSEIFLDPLNQYRVTAAIATTASDAVCRLIKQYFPEPALSDEAIFSLLPFLETAARFKEILIRPEVTEKLERAFNRRALTELAAQHKDIPKNLLHTQLIDYQKKGILFATLREAAVIADEMGLGKTAQAIGAAVFKKQLLGFKRTLVICPASLKQQWKQEIERFTNETALIADGSPEKRLSVYQNTTAFFIIVNYEILLKDVGYFSYSSPLAPDLLIVDEAQRIKNFATQTAQVLKKIQRKHTLALTGTPIENRLIDLYSIIEFTDPHFLSPLWEFSYQYCFFDEKQRNKITGYYNLHELHERLKPILLRRTKADVLDELPEVSEVNVPITLHEQQQRYHQEFGKSVAAILGKKLMTPFDHQKLMQLLAKMRMACNSTFLIDKETNHSPKLAELRHILLEKLDILHQPRKIIIFSEWMRMGDLIGKMLFDYGIGFTELNSYVPVKQRDESVSKFTHDASCKVLLCTDVGSTGLNLQIADTVINFEIPWNPAKKLQRMGRIDRIGQQKRHLTVINLYAENSIEEKIANGLLLKQSLMEGVLGEGATPDTVDLSAEGRTQFLEQLAGTIGDLLPVRNELTATPLAEEEEETEGAAPTLPIADEKLRQVLQSSMDFLGNMLKIATGAEVVMQENYFEIHPETGEIMLRFKVKPSA